MNIKLLYKRSRCNKQAHLYWLILLFHLYKNITYISPLRTSCDLDWLIHISLMFLCLRGPAIELWPRSHALHLRDAATFDVFFPLYVVNTVTVTWLPQRSDWAFYSTILYRTILSITGSGREHRNNKLMAGWSLWTILDTPLLFSLLPPPSLSATAQHRERRWWWAPSFPSRPPLLVPLWMGVCSLTSLSLITTPSIPCPYNYPCRDRAPLCPKIRHTSPVVPLPHITPPPTACGLWHLLDSRGP